MVTTEQIAFAHPRYRRGPVLGRGAQGVVLQVQDCEDPQRPLVAKLYRPGLLAEAQLRAEFALLARMRVPGLVRAHDLGVCEADGAPFLVEDRIDGPDALSWVQASEPLRVQRLLRVLVGAARGLAALHEAGFLHGDLKPAHVRIAGERPVLLDLGAATEAVAHARVCTFTSGYAAPEVSAGGRADARSDLYGLGALAWAAAVGCAPGARPEALRTRAPWVPPRIADVVDRLLATHPQDRLASALDLLGMLGVVGGAGLAGSSPAPIGRSSELQSLLAATPERVRYLVGETGSGKSHLLRELRVAALLAGRTVRLLTPREDSAAQVAHWVALLRGQAHREALPELLLVDALESAPSELSGAIESFRVFAPEGMRLHVIAATRGAPAGAPQLGLQPLPDGDLAQLAAALGVPESQRKRLISSAAGNPGWLVATLGRELLTAEAVLARTRDVSPAACTVLAGVAAVGGSAPRAWLQALELPDAAIAESLATSLLRRRALPSGHEVVYEVEAASLCPELARVLASPELIAAAARVLLAAADATPEALLALAHHAEPGARRALLTAAAGAAREAHARELEIDALLALGRDPAARSFSLLARLERLLRDAGRQAEHAEVVTWLEAAAGHDERMRGLSLRRSAEQRAREGNHTAALQLADAALELARERHDPLLIAQALATRGAARLFSSDHAAAWADLREARAGFSRLSEHGDREELARLDHNLGVVALYRGQLAEASASFQAALQAKQALGDRAGMRACLRNLGYTATRAERYDEAEHWLSRALQLARSLRQGAGEAWSLVALAEVEARRGNGPLAERHLAELEALGPSVPATVQADVALVRAELALNARDAGALERALAGLDPALCASDAQVDANRLLLEARAQLELAQPVARAQQLRAAMRDALAALRRARAAELALAVRDAERVLARIRAARSDRRASAAAASGEGSQLAATRDFMLQLATLPATEVVSAFARHASLALGAERVFMLRFEGAHCSACSALDMDGLPISEPERRVDLAAARAALSGEATLAPKVHSDGRGVRVWFATPPLAASQARWVALAEHRFLPSAFARLDPELARDLSALLTLAARLAAAPVHPASTSGPLSAATEPSSRELPAHSSSALPTITPRHVFPGIVGSSRALRSALLRLDAAIDSDLPLLLTGETGVGKEMFARAVAELGPRRGRPFVAVNCAAISGSLFESEFFGHERGAFTGAERRRVGVLLQADTGVLLLDEIGDLPLPQQVALLRALETKLVRPLGAESERKFDLRLVAATNRDLDRAVAEGTFRRDLLYRINVLEVRVPSLRERAGDIEQLALHFLRNHRSTLTLSPAALEVLRDYAWPGNVRELAHTMLRLSTLHDTRIELEHLPRHIRGTRTRSRPEPVRGLLPRVEDPKLEVLQTLEQTGGNISHAARVLGLTRHGLKKRMLRLGLRNSSRGENA